LLETSVVEWVEAAAYGEIYEVGSRAACIHAGVKLDVLMPVACTPDIQEQEWIADPEK
jgi:hypothetical protein